MNNKSQYNPRIHNRRSIRLKGYDYSKEGLYFITFCCQNRANLFGEIITVGADLNVGADLGVCPNEESRPSGLREENFLIEVEGRPSYLPQLGSNQSGGGRHGGLPQPGSSQPGSNQSGGKHGGLPQPHGGLPQPHEGLPQHLGSKLSSAIQWFKTMTTNEYIRGVKSLNWQSFDRRLWQRNYWEHIIRNEQAYDRISNYIKRNPSKWAEDQLFSKRKTK
jgi:REP element-mobilizing transposase RayT